MSSRVFLFGPLWGVILGIFYYGGLWLTVQRVPGANKPGRLLFYSFVFRLTAVLAAFWFILRQDPAVLAATLLFFFLTRVVLTRLLGRPRKGGVHANQS